MEKGTCACRAWYEGDPILEEYHDNEWCKENHDDRFQFEMLCLEGASVGLSWKTIMHKREAYRAAFHGFDIDACAAMSDSELEALMADPDLYQDQARWAEVSREYAQVERRLERAYQHWEEAQEAMAKIEAEGEA